MPSGIYTRKPFTVEHKNKMSEAASGEGNSSWKGGVTFRKAYCIECGKQLINNRSIYCSHCSRLGARSHFWKGEECVTPFYQRIRGSSEYKQWRDDIFRRDNWTCQKCGARSQKGKTVYLEAHHNDNSFAELLADFLREYDQFSPFEDQDTLIRLARKWQAFWTAEGITYCGACHKLKHKQPIET